MNKEVHTAPENVDATIDLSTFVPYFIASISNKSTSSASKLYLKRFGIGMVEWQAMVVLAIETQATAQNIADIVGIDKAAVSRAIKTLNEKEAIDAVKGTFRGRSKPYVLSEHGQALYHQISKLALEREKTLLNGFRGDEKKCLLEFLKRMQTNVALMQKTFEG